MDNCVRCEVLGMDKEADTYMDGVPLCDECIEEVKLERLNLNFD